MLMVFAPSDGVKMIKHGNRSVSSKSGSADVATSDAAVVMLMVFAPSPPVPAVSLTGLIVQDTGTYWTSCGQVVIITLIQLGGLGIMSLASLSGMLPWSAAPSG